MDKELEKMLKDIKEILEMLEDSDMGDTKEKFDNILKEAIETPCEISIKKGKNGNAEIGIKGNGLSVLVALAGAEQSILKEFECDNNEFNFIKNFIATREVK